VLRIPPLIEIKALNAIWGENTVMQDTDGPKMFTNDLEKKSVAALFALGREADGADVLAVESVMFVANASFGPHPVSAGVNLLWRATMQALEDVRLGDASRVAIDEFENRFNPVSPENFLQSRADLREKIADLGIVSVA
jgi:hypothetical protein